MDHVVFAAVLCDILKRIILYESELVSFLRRMVNANHIETCSVISHRGTASATKQIQ